MIYCYPFSHFFIFLHVIRKVHNTGGITIKWDTSAANDVNFVTEHSYLKKKTHQDIGYYKLVRERRSNSREDKVGKCFRRNIQNDNKISTSE
jgi:hypothetical protein